jgi:hypothetical protein
MATSGVVKNASIDDPEVFGITRLKFPPSCLDVKLRKRDVLVAGSQLCTNIGLVFIVSVVGDTYHLTEMTPCDTVTRSKKAAYFKAQEANIQDGFT